MPNRHLELTGEAAELIASLREVLRDARQFSDQLIETIQAISDAQLTELEDRADNLTERLSTIIDKTI
jgi:hypothetical protein